MVPAQAGGTTSRVKRSNGLCAAAIVVVVVIVETSWGCHRLDFLPGANLCRIARSSKAARRIADMRPRGGAQFRSRFMARRAQFQRLPGKQSAFHWDRSLGFDGTV